MDPPIPAAAGCLRLLAPRERIAALADAGSIAWLGAAGPSPYLARYGLAAQDDDGVVAAHIAIGGGGVLVAAQDERFLGGSVGARHAARVHSLFERARADCCAVVLLAASGGVRLHEANAAEWALGRALRALLDARVCGVPMAALAVGDVFGGASVLACAAGRPGVLPGIRIGLSGPKVIATAQQDPPPIPAREEVLAGAARVEAGYADAVDDDANAIRTWLLAALRRRGDALEADLQRDLAAVGAGPPDAGTLPVAWNARHVEGPLWRNEDAWIVAPWGARTVGVDALAGLDRALLAHVGRGRGPGALVLVEDSLGHEVSYAAEAHFISGALAAHAAVLACLRRRGTVVLGALTGTGHSAAFFTNGLQADALYAGRDARVVAMAPAAIARVTGLDASTRIEDDPMLGQPVRHFAALGGIAAMPDDLAPARLIALHAAR